ncbi:MAG TPA: hypothetical protein VIO38_15015 [Rariglobus sp.]
MTPPADGSSSWEQLLVQMVSEVRTDVREVRDKLNAMVPRPEFEAAQRGIDLRFAEQGRLIAEKREAHAALESKIQAVDDKVDAQESERHRSYRDMNGRVWLSIAGAALAFAGTIVAAIVGL